MTGIVPKIKETVERLVAEGDMLYWVLQYEIATSEDRKELFKKEKIEAFQMMG